MVKAVVMEKEAWMPLPQLPNTTIYEDFAYNSQ
jgi:hypothetical protein